MVGSLLAMRYHSSLGRLCERKAVAAMHCGSIDGRENAGPHTCSSKTMTRADYQSGQRQALRCRTNGETSKSFLTVLRWLVDQPRFRFASRGWLLVVAKLKAVASTAKPDVKRTQIFPKPKLNIAISVPLIPTR